MAMLAEPRQRKRYNLVPRGKALYEDDSRYGTKMLEKMGWSKGKGLGAKEDGSQDFVRVRYKNDAQGLGYEQRDDQWTQHEQSFSGLLKTLNGEEDTAGNGDPKIKQESDNESEDDIQRVGFGFQDTNAKVDTKSSVKKVVKLKEEISGISLEERSKQSKARVHYKKFTKGKDLSQYSEKDLANIFGKKPANEQQTPNDLYQQLSESFKKSDENKEKVKEDVHEKFGGVQIISTGVSVSDYFKMKMEALKSRQNGNNCNDNNADILNISDEVQEEEISKKKKKRKKDPDVESKNVMEHEANDKKRKKSKKGKHQDFAIENSNEMKEEVESKKEKKSKRSKHQDLASENTNEIKQEVETIDISTEEESTIKNEKVKIKKKQNIEKFEQQDEITNNVTGETSKTKKRKHDYSSNSQSPEVSFISEINFPPETHKNKKKKNEAKMNEIIQIEDSLKEDIDTISEVNKSLTEKKTKKKKSKTNKESNQSPQNDEISKNYKPEEDSLNKTENSHNVKKKEKNSAI